MAITRDAEQDTHFDPSACVEVRRSLGFFFCFFFFGLVDFWSMFGRFCRWSMGFFDWDFFGGMDNVM